MTAVERAELALARRQRELEETKAAELAAIREGRGVDAMLLRTSVQEAECRAWAAETTMKRERRRAGSPVAASPAAPTAPGPSPDPEAPRKAPGT